MLGLGFALETTSTSENATGDSIIAAVRDQWNKKLTVQH